MKITILGSGTSTGVPMVGCTCSVCSSTDPRDKRTRASLLIEAAGRYILVDTSPDLRRQALREHIPHIDAVLLTHSHADHVNGIDDLRGFHFIHRRVIPCYGNRETMDAVLRNFSYIFKGMEAAGYAPLLDPHVIHDPFALFGRTIVPIHLHHGTMPATGYRIDGAAYLTDCSRIPESSLALLGGLDLLVIDALRYTPHENHFNIDGALGVVAELRPKRTIFTHLTHEVAYADGIRLPEGVEFAYDGMTVSL
ncbi:MULTISPECIES: GPMC system MBL fold metallohydrolase [Geobacter]|uniref:Metal-dependent hydrolase, beta-lactamase superfamily n=1 Tax=Geobacter sulfurreducens (strain ATCC 51573 / DSM 12127 / PCA) TaxID=243231 RepID=Q74AC5_GEOSL|nr:GPMC system MBL fold metallohydrolase [Geobacter sulfurreducens]BET57465.1 GPMC system MBL fold metallohydrolase [Geobacter sp. 60473]AAR35838.1 metal-dependent hydrolase, beta-lactamase superfamily [Geobacter sulfurreducens PCA]UAC03167.1 GPMC system MBL fold metallohydrolase [Geobacter sulfurreducens]BEH09584.1 GPMC system MBL fold metallohydrolase [Geobacter sulfurreducens subsp. ethanolicus]HBB70832.1 MBL fold metallo-hydrolase [Geobacter sulfurreducens]